MTAAGWKSGGESLHGRGMAGQKERDFVAGRGQEELLGLLKSGEAAVRTAAAEELARNFAAAPAVIAALLERLAKEKHLYTRLALCAALEKGGEPAARAMVGCLGRIGSNQHRVLPARVSRKKSYPLPRDIIARTLGKMSPSVFPVLAEALHGEDASQISEALDAAGFMAFYHPSLATAENARLILGIMERFQENRLLQWKAILCLSAFPLEESVKCLESFCRLDGLLGEEARRSLELIQARG